MECAAGQAKTKWKIPGEAKRRFSDKKEVILRYENCQSSDKNLSRPSPLSLRPFARKLHLLEDPFLGSRNKYKKTCPGDLGTQA
jgi:hypothetical protein